jgi:hypothetical protein
MRGMTRSRMPLNNERIYAPYKIAALVEVLAEQGIAPETSLRGSGVSPEQIHDASALTSVRQYAAVCHNAVSLSCAADTAFKVGARLHLSAYGMYGYALMSCLSLRDFFRLGVKYHRLATPTLEIEWREHPDVVVWMFPDALISSPSRELKEFLIEQQFSAHVTHIRDVAGRDCSPIEAHFSYPAPEHADCYAQYLGCVCHFGQEHCELIYDSAILDRKPQLAHHLTATLTCPSPHCDFASGDVRAADRRGQSVGWDGWSRLSDPHGYAGHSASHGGRGRRPERDGPYAPPATARGKYLIREDPRRRAQLPGPRVSENDEDERG